MTNILIVEDEKIVAWDIKEALEKLGYRVFEGVATASEAILTASLVKPDLILMDIQLQGEMDGIAAAEEIYRRYKIPVVYLTAYADEQTLARAIQTSPFGYLIKPFQSKQLHTTIQIALQRHQLEQSMKQSMAVGYVSQHWRCRHCHRSQWQCHLHEPNGGASDGLATAKRAGLKY